MSGSTGVLRLGQNQHFEATNCPNLQWLSDRKNGNWSRRNAQWNRQHPLGKSSPLSRGSNRSRTPRETRICAREHEDSISKSVSTNWEPQSNPQPNWLSYSIPPLRVFDIVWQFDVIWATLPCYRRIPQGLFVRGQHTTSRTNPRVQVMAKMQW